MLGKIEDQKIGEAIEKAGGLRAVQGYFDAPDSKHPPYPIVDHLFA
jgi:hypothetical protein